MRLSAIRSVSVFGVGLGLAAGLGQGDTRLPMALPSVPKIGHLSSFTSLPWALVQAPKPGAKIPNLRVTPRPGLVVPRVQFPRAFGNVMPHSYLIYGLRTGPGGMACTDRNGVVIAMPFNPQIHMGPFTTSPTIPLVTPPTFTLPKLALPELTPKK